MHTASICTIGDEILIGQINDTNSGEIARALNKIGIRVVYMVSLRDDEKEIESGLSHCMDLSDIVIVTGGLGPTSDDKTKKVVADMFSMPLTAYHPGQLEVINNICRKRGVELSDLNRDQALVPLGCKVLINREGTAPGMIFEKKSAPDSPPVSIVCLLPGVPYEMRALLEQLTEYIRICYPIRDIIHKTILTYGIAESRLSEILSDWEKTLNPSLHLAYLPAPSSGVKLRISVYGEERDTAINIVSEAVNQLKEILQESIYGEDDDTLESVISKLLTSKSKTLSVAESCTGGRISSRITSLPGSSSFFKGSVVAYANSVKTDVLKIDEMIIEKYGAVSKECAVSMAEAVKEMLGSDYSIAVTGIAGPSGGTADKPVGTVWIAVSGINGTVAHKFIFTGKREQVIERSASQALNCLRLFINHQQL